MTQAWYNIVVVGTDLAGLIYASLAARLGYRVAVIGQNGLPNAYQHAGFTFLRQAERFYGFSTSPVVGKVFSDLSLHIEMKNRPQALDPTLQLVLPGVRLDLLNHRRRWEREVDRELVGAIGTIDAFDGWAEDVARSSDPVLEVEQVFPPTGLRAKTAYRRAMAAVEPILSGVDSDPLVAMDRDPRLRALMMAPVSHLSGLLSNPLSPLCVARVWNHLRAGLYRIPGGLDGLKAIFLRKIREQCGDYRPEATVDHLVVRRGKVTTVVLGDRGEELGCELVVGNMEPRHFLSLVSRDQREDGFHAELAGLQPAGWRFTLNLGVDPKIIPEGMGHELLLVGDPDRPLRGENCLWVSRPGVGPYAGGDGRPGPGVLQLSALLQSRGAAPTLGGARRLIDRSLEHVRGLIPWLDDYLKAVHTPAIAIDPMTDKAGLDPHQLSPVMGRALPNTLGASPFASSTSYRNILLCGDLLFSGLGFEGTCLAALQTLQLTRQLVKLKSALRGDRNLN